jgi:AcrR family transcriptional regulator
MLSSVGQRGYPARFSRDEIFSAAVDLLDEEPEAALTMKRLATHLGIAPMTLYGYVASKDELLEGVASVIFEGLFADIPRDAPWDEQLRHQTRAIHSTVVRHPGLARALRAHRSPNPSLFRVRERMLLTLTGAGFSGQAAMAAMGVLTAFAQGFAGLQAVALAPDDLADRARRLPADDFPLLNRYADVYADQISDDAFELGLDVLISGLRHRLH